MTGTPSEENGGLTVLIVSDGSDATRSFRISKGGVRWMGAGAGIGLLLVLLLVGSWVVFALRARDAAVLEARVEELVEREGQVEALAALLAEVEAGYEQIRGLFGPSSPAAGDLWLPPASGPSPGTRSAGPIEDGLPTSWPLTERGFITQTLLEGGGADHPGIDIAVPAGSYIRAAGGGVVAEAGDDPVYGLYLVLDHGEGYRSLYAHASVLLAEEGDAIRRNEVVALSGSSGRSTAPHLHFEILHEGVPLDPLSLVTQP